jgi:hypothetical protein
MTPPVSLISVVIATLRRPRFPKRKPLRLHQYPVRMMVSLQSFRERSMRAGNQFRR